MTGRLVIPPLAVALATALGCGTGGQTAATWHGTMDTLPSGQIVVHNPARPMWPDGSHWRVVEELRIGTVEGDGPDLFGEIMALAVDARGRVFVLESQANEIRAFDARGAHVRTFGREGAGPGEFHRPVMLQFGPDGNLWVADPQNNRISVFDTTGAYLEGKYMPGDVIMIPWPGGFDRQGSYYAPIVLPRADGVRIALVRSDSLLRPIDTVFVPQDPNPRERFERRVGTSLHVAFVPFAPEFRWRLAPDGTFWGMLEETYRLFQLTVAGDTLRSFTREFDPVPVTAADMERAREDLQWFVDYGGTVDWSKIPDHKPATEDVFFDDAGNIWVIPEAPAERAWRVADLFDPQGRYLGRIDLPFRMTLPYPTVRDDVMYAVVQDELEVPYVVRARIEKP